MSLFRQPVCKNEQRELALIIVNLDNLKYFLALSHVGTLSGAGKKLGVKHTTVARRVKVLESELGCKLFSRGPLGYRLTQAGENLERHAIQIDEHANKARREVLGQDAQLEGPLKLTAPYDFFCNIIAPYLHIFTSKFPKIDLELICSPNLIDLSAREADIAVRITATPPENLVGKCLLPLRHGIYVGDDYLAKRPEVDSIILWQSETGPPEWAKQHFHNAHVAARCDEANTMLALTANGMGVARLPCYIAEGQKHVRRLDLPITPSKWGVWLLSHPDQRSNERTRVCKQFLEEIILKNTPLIVGDASTAVKANGPRVSTS